MIYTFGNSHSHIFTNSSPGTFGVGENNNKDFMSISLGPTIAYNFYDHHYSNMLNWIKNLNINKDTDYIMLIVGEVDCRVHLPKQIEIQGRTIEDVVKECVDRFFIVYLDLISKGYKVLGWGGHPSTTAGPSDNPSEPIVGDCLFRNKISLFWNDYLEGLCLNKNIPYISIIKDLIDMDGKTKMEFFMDYCHLDHTKVNQLIKNKFNEFNIAVYE